MYTDFFKLTELPFSLTPDTSFYCNHSDHQEVLDMLLAALKMGEGFLKVTGEVGTGKTLLCRKLLNVLSAQEEYITAYMPNPAPTPNALRYTLADELSIQYPQNINQHQISELIHQRLIDLRKNNKNIVMIVDESQALSNDCLEAIRLLTNMETEKSKLLQVILFGQPELDTNLQQPSIRQLSQRITFSHHTGPLKKEIVAEYLAHRLYVAGYNGPALFDQKICNALYKWSNGTPRLINILAHKCLLAAYGQGVKKVTSQHLQNAVRDTDSLKAKFKNHILRLRLLFFGITTSSAATAAGTYWLLR